MSDMVERVARAIADQVGDGFDNAHRNKPHWVETRGESGGRFRDVNEPRQNDYLDAARAAIGTMRECSPAMIEAAGGEIINLERADDPSYKPREVWYAMIDAALDQ